jgi:hypothetical protein
MSTEWCATECISGVHPSFAQSSTCAGRDTRMSFTARIFLLNTASPSVVSYGAILRGVLPQYPRSLRAQSLVRAIEIVNRNKRIPALQS